MARTWSLAVAGLLAAAAHAQTLPVLDKASLSIGGFVADVDGTGALRDDNQTPPFSTGEQPILPDSRTVLRLKADALLFPRQGIAVDYLRFRGSKSNDINLPFVIQDTPFPAVNGQTAVVGADLGVDTSVDMLNLAWRWWFGEEATVWGVGLGIGYYKLDLTGSARDRGTFTIPALPGVCPAGGCQLSTFGYESVTWQQNISDSTTAPLITLGWRHRYSDTVRFYADAAGAKSNQSDFSGFVTNLAAGVEWFPWENVGFGAEYTYSRMHVTREGSGTELKFDLQLQGPALYVRMRY